MKKANTDVPQKPINRGTVLLRWKVPEYLYHKKGPIWKAVAIFCVIGFIIYGILTHSYPFSVVVGLFAGVYFLTHKEPKIIEIQVTDMGVAVDHRFYEYSNIRNFWIIYRPGVVENINFRVTKNVIKELSVLLGDQDPAELREILSRFVPEISGKDESFVDLLSRKLKL